MRFVGKPLTKVAPAIETLLTPKRVKGMGSVYYDNRRKGWRACYYEKGFWGSEKCQSSTFSTDIEATEWLRKNNPRYPKTR